MVYIEDEREEDVGINNPFINADEDGEDEEEGPPPPPVEEEEYE